MDQPMSYEEMMELLSLGGANSQLDAQMKMQQRQAEQLRGIAPLEMRGNGRVNVAPHWTEGLANLGGKIMGVNADRAALDAQKQMGTNQQTQNAMMLRALTRKPGIDPTMSPNMGPQLP